MTTSINGVNQILDPAKLRADLEINEIDLSASMMRQAGLFAFYANLHAQAEHQFAKKEQLLEIIEASIDKQIRDQAAADGAKLTEVLINKRILANPRFIKAKSQVNAARQIATLAKSATEAFRHRRDMLIQTAFNQREENKGELRVSERKQQVQSDARREMADRLRQGPSSENN